MDSGCRHGVFPKHVTGQKGREGSVPFAGTVRRGPRLIIKPTMAPRVIPAARVPALAHGRKRPLHEETVIIIDQAVDSGPEPVVEPGSAEEVPASAPQLVA